LYLTSNKSPVFLAAGNKVVSTRQQYECVYGFHSIQTKKLELDDINLFSPQYSLDVKHVVIYSYGL